MWETNQGPELNVGPYTIFYYLLTVNIISDELMIEMWLYIIYEWITLAITLNIHTYLTEKNIIEFIHKQISKDVVICLLYIIQGR